MQQFAKAVIVPAKLDGNGMVVADDSQRGPYGYHHVCGVGPGARELLLATVWHSIPVDTLNEAVRVMVGALPVEVDADYYRKQRE